MSANIKTWQERHADWETETVRDAMQAEIDDLRAALAAATAPIVAQPVVDDERAAFEHWMSDEGKTPKAIERSGESYLLAQAAHAWWVWQARSRLQAPTIPPGWQCVPKEPTPEMVDAFHCEEGEGAFNKWTAMLAAAPAVPADKQGE